MQGKSSPLFHPILLLLTKTVTLTLCFPFLLGIPFDLVLCLTDPADPSFPADQNMQELVNQANYLVFFAKQAKDISDRVYSSFTQFMVLMLMNYLMIHFIQRPKLTTVNDPKRVDMSVHRKTLKFKRINSVILSIFGYALAYSALYSILGIKPVEARSLAAFQHLESQDNEYLTGDSSRMLGDIQQPLKMKEEFNKKNPTSFPLGRALESLNIDTSSVVFSKDETILFASSTSFFGVSVVDVSNWENPRVIQDYKLIVTQEKMQKISLLLSPDGKSLFISNIQYFARLKLDDSNFIYSTYSSQTAKLPEGFNESFETSLALSPNGTQLFASGYGLLVLNVSKQNQLEAFMFNMETKLNVSPSIALSSDGKFLFHFSGTLDIYNRADFPEKNLISRFVSENTPCSFIQSKDKKIITLIGFQKGTNKVVLERVDVSDVTAPKLTKTFTLSVESFSCSFSLNQSPKEIFLYFTIVNEASERKMMVFDLLNERLLEDNQNLISRANLLLFTSNEKKVIATFREHITMIELYQNYPNDRIFSISKETFAPITGILKSSNRVLKLFSTSNGKFLLSVNEMDDGSGSRFTFTDISNQFLPVEINWFSADRNVKSAAITNDGKILSVSWKTRIIIYDISDLRSINILGSKTFDEEHEIFDAVFTSDGKTCFAAVFNEMRIAGLLSINLKVFDLSDPASIKEIDSFSHHLLNTTSPRTLLALSKDEKTIFVVHTILCVFDVSARTVNASSGSGMLVNDVTFVPSSISLSPTGEILIIKEEDLHSSSFFIFDLSNQDGSGVNKLSGYALPKAKAIKNIPIGFSHNGQRAYTEGLYGGLPGLLVFDISNPSSPRFQNAIKIEEFIEGSVNNFIISDDGRRGYLASDFEKKIYIINLDVLNTAFLRTENFPLGEKSLTDVMVLRQNDRGNYAPLGKNYRFVKASLFSTKIVPAEFSIESTFTHFPYWMTFEKEAGNFAIEPKKQRDLGTYTLYSVFSTQLNKISLESISNNNTTQIRAIFGSLISLGYLDNDLYVTGNFGTFDSFYFTGPDSEKIYQILKENYFETWTVFDIVPSLDILTSGKKLEVQTPSDNSIKVEITLLKKGIQFLKKQYGPLVPLITENKAKFSIEGSVDDVNNALENLVIDLNVGGGECAGMITIWDHLNPVVNKTLKNLTRYFEVNEAPRVNDGDKFNVQGQVDAKAIYTGENFAVNFLNHTFIDKYSESLQFTLTLDDKERSSAPNWVVFSDLSLKGTAPEEFFNRKVSLLLTVKNEFKRIEVPLTVNIKLSYKFILKLLVKYSPYILTALGLWAFANRIYNVVKKNKYRHRKDFYLSVGQEITAQDIYPIRFLGQEGVESDLIWKHLKKKELDKYKLIGQIKEAVQKIPEKDLPLYKKGSALSRKLIYQLIMNRMALWLIDSEQEKQTKKIYKAEIEDHLMDLVKWDDDNDSGSFGDCHIDELKLLGMLKERLNQDDKEEDGMEVGLINRTPINVDLLKDVVIAEAMKCQSLLTRALFTHVIIKEEVPGNWIKRFLKKNLYDLQSAQKGQKMAYGIDYEIKNDVLCFSGVAEEKFCGRTIVLQITDLRHKILKEVWIHGATNKVEEWPEEILEAQGNRYEIL